MTDYTPQEARESDTTLAEHQAKLYQAMDNLNSVTDWILSLAGATRVRSSAASSFWSFNGTSWATLTEAESRLAAKLDDKTSSPTGNVAIALRRLSECRAAVDGEQRIVDACEKAWNEHGRWTRFFAVAGGHIHSSSLCQSLRPTTRIGWLPELSGKTEQEAVDRYGSVLCTFCFPSAPVAWTAGKLQTQAQLQRENERQKKAADAAANEVVDPATSATLLDAEGRALKTERAASNALVDALFCLRWYGDSHPEAPAWQSYTQRAVPALARRRGVSDDTVLSEYTDKAEKKYRRESR